MIYEHGPQPGIDLVYDKCPLIHYQISLPIAIHLKFILRDPSNT